MTKKQKAWLAKAKTITVGPKAKAANVTTWKLVGAGILRQPAAARRDEQSFSE